MRARTPKQPAPTDTRPLEHANEALLALKRDQVNGAAVLQVSQGKLA